jgi:hypothetical protein
LALRGRSTEGADDEACLPAGNPKSKILFGLMIATLSKFTLSEVEGVARNDSIINYYTV